LRDEIVELAIQVASKPSFPLPRVLSTRIATSETIGILPIGKSLAESYKMTTLPRPNIIGVPHHRDTPVHILTRLSTKTTNLYRYDSVFFMLSPQSTRTRNTSHSNSTSDNRTSERAAKYIAPMSAGKILTIQHFPDFGTSLWTANLVQ
jgi:hypothetical protein